MPRKRSNGEGSIHKRPNGLWEWQIMVGYHPDGRRKTKSFYVRTQKEVKEKGTRFLEQMALQPKLNGEMLFSDWADMWYESMKGQVSDTTYEGYQFTLKLLKDYFGTMPPGEHQGDPYRGVPEEHAGRGKIPFVYDKVPGHAVPDHEEGRGKRPHLSEPGGGR